MLSCAYTICLYGQISISCTSPCGSPCPPSRVSSYTLSVLICCIRLLWDWSFSFYQHITYICFFLASYLFSLWYDWFLWRYFVLLSRENQFFLGFFFLARSMFSRVRRSFYSFKTLIRLFFFPFLFPSYCHFVDNRVVSIVSGGYNQSSFVIFYVVLESLYRCVNVVFNSGKSSSSLLSWYI